MSYLPRLICSILIFIWLGCFGGGYSPLAFAQSPYHLNGLREGFLGTTTVLGLGIGHALEPQPLNASQIAQLNPQKVPQLDRFVTKLWSPQAQKHSDYLLYGSMLLPLVLLADADIRHNLPEAAVVSAQSIALTMMLTNLTKNLVHRSRPFLYNSQAPMNKKLKSDAVKSFFSGHTSIAAVCAFSTAKIYLDHNPNSRYKPLIWTTAALLPALTAYLRVKGGKHFLSDVLVGYIVGSAVGIGIPAWHKRKH